MAETWDLVLHHNFKGTPGVVLNSSPTRSGVTRVHNIDDAYFLPDGGYEYGSGSVDLRAGGYLIVEPSPDWLPLRGFKYQIVFARNTVAGSYDMLAESDAFVIHTRDEHLEAHIFTTTGNFALRATDLPADQWLVVTLACDGVCSASLDVDGTVVDSRFQPLDPLKPIGNLKIGAIDGEVDDVMLHRLNPHRAPTVFVDRPMDPGIVDCWKDWGRHLIDALNTLRREYPECPGNLLDAVERTVHGGLGRALTHSDQSRTIVSAAGNQYREEWGNGNLTGVSDVVRSMTAGLRHDGHDLERDPDLVRLLQSECWRRFIALLKPLECDPDFIDMMKGAAR